MFDRETLDDVAETILCVNLLLAVLSLIALYDQRRLRDGENATQKIWEGHQESQLEMLTLKVEQLEESIALLIKSNERQSAAQ